MSPTTWRARTGGGDQPVVVVSAMGHETDDLLGLGRQGVHDATRGGKWTC